METEGHLAGEFDPVRIQQVITNLLINGGQFRDKDHPVTVRLSGRPDHLEVLVKNREPVSAPAALHAIFNPLVQLAPDAQGQAPSRPATSMGLGLFVAREITQAHSGTIDVVSTEKEGTIFVSVRRTHP